jgi:hypothetical protein
MAAGTAHASHAGLSLDGQTGVARTPLAIALAPMTLGIAADYVFSDETFVPARLEFGVIKGLEIGGKFWYTNTDAEIKVFGGNAKYVLPQFVENLGFAVGANYDSFSFKEGDNLSKISGYAVATYTIMAGPVAIVPSVGGSYEQVKKDDADIDENGARFFGSVVVMVLPNLAVGGELISTNKDLDGEDADASYWAGVRYMPIDGLTLQAGYINNANITNDGDLSDGVFHLGAQYAFSFGN